METLEIDNFDERCSQLIELSSHDEAEGTYDTDYSGIFYDPIAKDFVIMEASGCSCWNGEGNETHFPSLEDVKQALFDNNREFSPSLTTSAYLVIAAYKKYRELYQEGKI